MIQQKLRDLEFVDLYVCLEGDADPHYHQKPGITRDGEENIDIPPEFRGVVDSLTAYLKDKFTEDEMGVTFDGVRMRAAKVRTAGGALWAALRKINAIPMPIGKLCFPISLIPHLQALGKRDGLILICGATGQGKTTTACSLLADFLKNQGGVAFTIEDPVEYDLEGRHGNSGYCYQAEIREDREWSEMLKRSLRWHPRYIFVGEIRTPDAANQLLRAATSGHLVLTTVHAGSIEEALEGILQLSEQALGERATSLLATGLTAIIHQAISPLGLVPTYYITDALNPSSPFRSCIRDKRVGQIRTFIDQQSSLLMQTGRLFREGRS